MKTLEDLNEPGTASPWKDTLLTRGGGLAFAVFVSCLVLTWFVWHNFNMESRHTTEQRFQFRTSELKVEIIRRFMAYEQVLRGGQAVFKAFGMPSREQWRAYIENLDINRNYPGIQGIGFSLAVRPEDRAVHEKSVQTEGFPNYRIRPDGARPMYTSIIFLEPFDARNKQAFGYDMFSEPVRRAAMEQARDSGEPSVTGKVRLVQEIDSDVQAGFLMYLPLYRAEASLDTVEARRNALIGFVYSPFRMRNFLEGVLGSQYSDIDLEIFDGREQSLDHLMYDSDQSRDAQESDAAFFLVRSEDMEIYGRAWKLLFRVRANFGSPEVQRTNLIILGAGGCISLLAFFMVLSLAGTRRRALALAERMTIAYKESEHRFRSVIEKNPAGICITDRQGLYRYVNPAYCRLYGVSAVEILGRHFLAVCHPDSCDAFQALLERNVRQDGVQDELEVVRKDGLSRFIVADGASIVADDGQSLLVLFVLDVTARTLAEKAILESEEKATLLLNSTGEAIYGIDLAGRCTFCNPATLRMLGFDSQESLLGKNMHELIHHTRTDGSHYPIDECRIYKAFKLQQGVHADDELLWRADGSSFPAEYWSYPQYRNGEIVGAVVAFIDITERKRAEATLRESEDRFRAMSEASHDALVMIDSNDDILFWSWAAERMFGFTKEEALQCKLHDLIVTDEDRTIAHAGIKDFTHYGTGPVIGTVMELTAVRKDGKHFPVERSVAAFQVGPKWYAVGTIRDITERKKAEEEIRSAREQAEEANRAKSSFLANMSHEIRTPMNAILGLAHLALRADLDRKQRGYLVKIQRSAKALLGILNDILDFSKIEAGRLGLEHIGFNLEHVLRDVGGIIGVRAGGKGLDLLFDLPREVPQGLQGDPLRLSQVLINLLGNAVKFTEHGEIVLEVALVRLLPDAARIRFVVRDTGLGLRPEQQTRLFEAFSQGDGTTTRRFGGTGLGLAISRRLVDLMGGFLRVASQEGVGSEFAFEADFDLSPEQAPDLAASQQKLGGRRILLVEPNPLARRITAAILGTFGCRVLAEPSAEAAQEFCVHPDVYGSARPIDLLVADGRLTAMADGSLAACLRRVNPGLRAISIFPSGWEAPAQSQTDDDAPLALDQPVTFSSLLEAMQEVLLSPEQRKRHSRMLQRNASSAGNLHGARILVVEDNDVNRQVARELLQSVGAQALLAEDGRMALDILARERVDIVLMDVQMPGMDGYETTHRIRADASLAGLPIIAMTASVLSEDRQRCLDAGMNDHVGKPIEPENLFAILARHLAGADASHDSQTLGEAEVTAAASPQPEPERLPGIDWEMGLTRVAGNAAVYRRLLAESDVWFRETVQDIRQALDHGDQDTVRNLAHKAKGAAGTLSATHLYQLFLAFEEAVAANAAQEIATLLGTLESAMDEFHASVAKA